MTTKKTHDAVGHPPVEFIDHEKPVAVPSVAVPAHRRIIEARQAETHANALPHHDLGDALPVEVTGRSGRGGR